MDHGGERRSGSGHEATLRTVQRPAVKPWRGGGSGGGGGTGGGATAAMPAPPKVYQVAPRDFQELVQRLTGAGTAPPAARQAADEVPPAPAYAVAEHGKSSEDAAAAEMFDYAQWFSVPLLSPASMPTSGYDGHHLHHHANGALI
ncbi:hypothetical protein GUJ93_ZPchr0003g16728 [Zizania palustris]|uniref:VQ domain-containing protein n=1 Tax=Zizania palustris TaxID=103762 RepID=A0A8J5SV20_ZIZPA|nr:hypothetical protein GUJ93_ZPchr0003g16728 [Zizania palustris]